MFDQILDLVKGQLNSNPQVASAIPAGQEEAVHNEIASHLTDGIKNQAASQGGAGGLLDMLRGAVSNNSPVTAAIEGGLVSSLASKFGLPPAATGAIAAALPGLLQKFAHKAADPNDSSITMDSITKSMSGGMGGLGSLFGK